MKLNNPVEGKVILALSGGVDSVVLFHLFLKQKIQFICVHVNHNLRASESDADQQFVEDLCKKNQIEIFTKKLEQKPKNEEEARDARYAFLEEIRAQEQADFIALAQHKNDQVETCLLQLIRGTQFFSPMKEFDEQQKKWRPLLGFSKLEILQFAQDKGLEWREDATNKENIFSRNKLRNIVIPELEKINSNFSNTFLGFVEGLQEQKSFVEKHLLCHLERSKGLERSQEISHPKGIRNDNLLRKDFLNLHPVLQSALLKKMNPKLYSKNIEEVIEMIEKGIGGKEKHGFVLEQGGVVVMKN